MACFHFSWIDLDLETGTACDQAIQTCFVKHIDHHASTACDGGVQGPN
jgi:hypothetical protein